MATTSREARDRHARADDGDLVRRCLEGHAEAWEALIRRYRRLIYSMPAAYRISGDEADEIFQSVAVKLFQNLGSLRSTDSLASWIAVTARRECQAARRGEARFTDLDSHVAAGNEPRDEAPDVLQAIEEIEAEHTVALALERLGEPCRSLLTALYVEDPPPSYEELGRRLGRPIGSLGPTRARCLKKLKELVIAAGTHP